MKIIPVLSSLLFFILLMSCQNEDKNSAIHLIPSGKYIKLPLDNNTPVQSDGVQYYHGEQPLLFNLNWAKNSIQIYDINSKSKIKELEFATEGPDGVGYVFGIHVHNLDSIFLFNQGIGQMSLADTSGRVYSKIKYKLPEKYTPAFVHNAYFLSSPILIGNKLIVKTHFHGQITAVTNDEISEKELMYAIDLTKGTTQFMGFKYPKDYLIGGSKYFEPSIAFANGKFVVSYFGDHNVYYADNMDSLMKSKPGKSPNLGGELAILSNDADPMALRKYAYGSPHYETILHDPFRKVYLRFAFHQYELDPDVQMQDLRNYSGPFSIQVFDEELNIISEKTFEKNTYHPFDFFVAEEGLYLSINHPLNPEINEDILAFELIYFN